MTVAALVGPACSEVWSSFMDAHAPALAGEAMSVLIGTAAAMFAAYWVRDRANVVEDGAAGEN